MRQHRAELTLLRSLEVRRVQMREDWMAARALANADANAQAHAQEMPSSLVAKMKQLKAREVQLRAALPDYVQKLIGGFELRVYHFELIDCARKLAIVCMPVFFKPSGSVSQLIFGLVVCFVTFAAYIYYAPYVSGDDNRLAQLCQVQIFFSLLSAIALKYDDETIEDPTNFDMLLSALTFAPIVLTVLLETPLNKCIGAEARAAQYASLLQMLTRKNQVAPTESLAPEAAVEGSTDESSQNKAGATPSWEEPPVPAREEGPVVAAPTAALTSAFPAPSPAPSRRGKLPPLSPR